MNRILRLAVTLIFVLIVSGGMIAKAGRREGSFRGLVWSPSGDKIAFLYSLGYVNSIMVANSDGTSTYRLTNIDADPETPWNSRGIDYNDSDPVWSPEGTRLAFSRSIDFRDDDIEDTHSIVVVDLQGNILNQIDNEECFIYEPEWSSDGSQIAYSANCVADDREEVRIWTLETGDDFVLYNSGKQKAWSPDGLWIAVSGWRDEEAGLYIVHPNGEGLLSLDLDQQYANSASGIEYVEEFEWSKDSKTLAVAGLGHTWMFGLVDIQSNSFTRASSLLDEEVFGMEWSPNGQYIAINYNYGMLALYDKTENTELFHLYISQLDDIQWSPDGNYLTFSTWSRQYDQNFIWRMDLENIELDYSNMLTPIRLYDVTEDNGLFHTEAFPIQDWVGW